MARAQDGDSAAFSELVRRHVKDCRKRAVHMLRNPSDAEDEVQNALWKAFERLRQFRGRGTFAAWLRRIVENQCLMRLRCERDLRFIYLDEATDSNVQLELVGQSPGPEDQLGVEEVIVLLRREISRIPPLLRGVLLLRDVDQLPMPEVAARLGLSIPAAKSRLMRARAELRSRLERHCGRKGPSTLLQADRHSQSAFRRAG